MGEKLAAQIENFHMTRMDFIYDDFVLETMTISSDYVAAKKNRFNGKYYI